MLASILDPAKRLSEFQRKPGNAQFLRVQHAFVAEAPRRHRARSPAPNRDLGDPHMLMCGAWADPLTSWPARPSHCAMDAPCPRADSSPAAPYDIRAVTPLGCGGDDLRDLLVERGLQEQVVLPFFVHQRRWGVARRERRRRRRAAHRGRAQSVLARSSASARVAAMPMAIGLADEAHLGVRQRRIVGWFEAGKCELRLHRGDVDVRRARRPTLPEPGGLRIERIRACASGLRRNATSRSPGSAMSPT